MLTYLELKNYIFIKELKLEFKNGLNIFTGETGAGKSIIIEAISLLCGEKQKTSVVGSFSEKCEIVGIFELNNNLKENFSEISEFSELSFEDELIVRREIDKQNKSKFFINDKVVTSNFVKKILNKLVDIHGQNEHQKLLVSSDQLEALDKYTGISQRVKNFKNQYYLYKKKLELLDALKNEIQHKEKQLELIKYQISEIEQANLTPEDETLEEELEKAKNVQKILNLLSEVKFNLTEISQKILTLQKLFQMLNQYIKELNQKSLITIETEIENLNIQTESYKKFFSTYTTEYIDNLIDRVDLIKKLKRKYGKSIQEIKSHYEDLKKQLNQINIKDQQLEEIQKETINLKEYLIKEAKEISEIRNRAAKEIEKEINMELPTLGLQKAKIKIKLESLPPDEENLGPSGLDKIEFLISTNPGSPFLPLKEIASGGELSRIMLAIKTVLGKKEETPFLIFDEIDSGVGGPMGFVIGKKLKQLTLQNKQIFCITHLPQIACFGDIHFAVKKYQSENTTLIEVETLNGEKRIEELARMLSGSKINETSLNHAKKLIKEANESFNKKI
ncbi:MAG: DNA repair protein RecN [Endomicrobiia bacterium]